MFLCNNGLHLNIIIFFFNSIDAVPIAPIVQTIEEMDNAFIHCNFTSNPVTWSMLGRKNLPLNAHPISLSMFISRVGRQNQGCYVCSGKYNSTNKFKARSLLLVLCKLNEMK